MIYKYEIESEEKIGHSELINKILVHPEMIAQNFEALEKEVIILRGKVDIVGKLDNSFCLVEVKVSKQAEIMIKAKKQLARYARAINYTNSLFGISEIPFKYVIVRKLNHYLKINIYDSEEDLLKEKYLSGKGYLGVIDNGKIPFH